MLGNSHVLSVKSFWLCINRFKHGSTGIEDAPRPVTPELICNVCDEVSTDKTVKAHELAVGTAIPSERVLFYFAQCTLKEMGKKTLHTKIGPLFGSL